MEHEVDAGLKLLSETVRATQKLELREVRRLHERRAYYIVLGSGRNQTDIVLTNDFLSNLPNTVDLRLAAQNYATWTAKRMQNSSPAVFYCKSGVPIKAEIELPVQAIPGRSASFVNVSVVDLRTSTVAVPSVIITRAQYLLDLKQNPFLREIAIINTVRRAVDARELSFYQRTLHPTQLQELPLDPKLRANSSEPDEVADFIAGKVYWLAFRQGDKSTQVWIADEWDAHYLGTDSRALIQQSQILEAQKDLVLDSTQEFASAGDGLLVRSRHFETGGPTRPREAVSNSSTISSCHQWDLFICHASEDKTDFVRPLAEALRQQGQQVWFDEFTLKVGDSLRRSIDRGLANSKFGVVVLSPAFFSKEWPQRELDGLTAKEIQGKKVILPVWHKVTRLDVSKYSLVLADRMAASSSEGLEAVVAKLLDAMKE